MIKSFEQWLESALQGNTEAQYRLGIMYNYGNGVSIDYKKATEWYEKAALQGYPDAQFSMGRMYEDGRGNVPINASKAFEWYEKAALQGHSEAQYKLGQMYEDGYGIPLNYEKAFEWYQKAAINGDRDAYSSIGKMYAKGNGVIKNDIMAYAYCSIAEDYDEDAMEVIDSLQNQMTQVQIKEAQDISQELLKKLDEIETIIIKFGKFEKAALHGDSGSQIIIGHMYKKGECVLRDYVMAYAYLNVASLYYEDKNAIKFRDELQTEMTQTQIDKAKYITEELFKTISINIKERDELEKASLDGNVEAQYKIGGRYEEGYGFPEDYVMAYAYFNIAAQNNHRHAKRKIVELLRYMSQAQINKAQDICKELIKKIGENKKNSL